MQHLERWFRSECFQQQQQEQSRQQQHHQILQQHNFMSINTQLGGMNLAHQSATPSISPFTNPGFSGNGNTMNQYQDFSNAAFNQSLRRLRPRNMLEAHVMIALDSLTDGRNLYCVMPYCSGGELFDMLEKKTRFSEPEARYWMRQLLQVSVSEDIILCYMVPFISAFIDSKHNLLGPNNSQRGRNMPS